MNDTNRRVIAGGAVIGWIGVGIYGIWEITGEESGDGWERPYFLYSVALFAATAFTLSLAWMATSDTGRTTWRRVAMVVGGLALLSTLVAWAMPLWMTLIAVSLAAAAWSAPRHERSGLATLAGAQLVGLAAMIAAIEAQVGDPDSYGDYPAAFGIGLVVTAVLSVVGAVASARAMPPTGAASLTSLTASRVDARAR